MEAIQQALFHIPHALWWTLNNQNRTRLTIGDKKKGLHKLVQKTLKARPITPITRPVHIIAGISDYSTGRPSGNDLAIYDSENAHPVVKTIIDALVTEKILADDNPQIVESVSFTRMATTPPKGTHYVHFVLIPARETVYDLVLKGRNK